MIEFSKKLQQLPQQFFAALVNKVNEALAEGRDVINLGQGNPTTRHRHILLKHCKLRQTTRKHINIPHSAVFQSSSKRLQIFTNVNIMSILILLQKWLSLAEQKSV